MSDPDVMKQMDSMGIKNPSSSFKRGREKASSDKNLLHYDDASPEEIEFWRKQGGYVLPNRLMEKVDEELVSQLPNFWIDEEGVFHHKSEAMDISKKQKWKDEMKGLKPKGQYFQGVK